MTLGTCTLPLNYAPEPPRNTSQSLRSQGPGDWQLEKAKAIPTLILQKGKLRPGELASESGLGCKSPGPAGRPVPDASPLHSQGWKYSCRGGSAGREPESAGSWIVQLDAAFQRCSVLENLEWLQLWTFPPNNLIKPGSMAVPGNDICVLCPPSIARCEEVDSDSLICQPCPPFWGSTPSQSESLLGDSAPPTQPPPPHSRNHPPPPPPPRPGLGVPGSSRHSESCNVTSSYPPFEPQWDFPGRFSFWVFVP